MPITTAMLRWFTSATYIDNTSQEISAKDVRDGFNLVADAIDTAVATTVGADPETVKDWADAAALLAISAQDSAALASTKATESAASADVALTSRNSAASSATTATTKASEAAASAAAALTSRNSATSSATTATTKASEAAASAATALTNKNSAASSATTATTKASEAAASAATATSKASEAASSAALAASAVTTVGGRNPLIGNMSVTDNSINSGNYQYVTADGSSGGPAGITFGHVTHYRRAAGGGEAQVFIAEVGSGFTTGTLFTRTRVTGAWTAWRAVAFETFPASYNTLLEFKAAIAASLYVGVPSGFSVTAGGTTYIRDASFTGIPGLSGWYQPWMKQKHLLSADWQPKPSPEFAGNQAVRLRAVMDKIASRHPDLTHAHLAGDLVHVASVDSTGAAPSYGFRELLADWRTRLPIPLANAYFIAGNHDQDGVGTISEGNFPFRECWTMQTYRSWIGAEFYYTLQGNLLNIYAGDMGGRKGGVISTPVVDWMKSVMLRHKDCNIFLHIHQPIGGTYLGWAEPSRRDDVQVGSDRIIAVLNQVAAGADNICAVFFGHVGSANQFNDETWYGTRHIQIGMHIPSNVDAGRNDQYYVMNFTHGSSVLPIQQWDASADTLVSTKNITLKYPLQLADGLDFDGRDQADESVPQQTPQTAMLVLDEYRQLISGSWQVPSTTPLFGYTVRVEDRSNDTTPVGLEVGYAVDFPAAQHAASTHEETIISGNVSSLGITWVKVGGGEDTPEVGVNLYGAGGYGTSSYGRQILATFNPSKNAQPGLVLPNGMARFGSFAAGSGFVNPSTAVISGSQIDQYGRLIAGTNGTAAIYAQRNGVDGAIVNFYKGTSSVGAINVTTTATAYVTTSDKRLKVDWKEFDGLATVGALKVWEHGWIGHDHRSKGVLAQDAALVAPYAVSEGNDETPWAVDYSKLVPDLIRAVQQLTARLEELEGHHNGK